MLILISKQKKDTDAFVEQKKPLFFHFFIVALTVGAISNTYNPGSAILFLPVHTQYGVSTSEVLAVSTRGTYRVEKSGLYLISIYIMTNTNNDARFVLYKTGVIIGYSYPNTGSHYRTSSLFLLKNLNFNDTLEVKSPYYKMYVLVYLFYNLFNKKCLANSILEYLYVVW